LSGNSARCALWVELNKRWNYSVPVLNRYMNEKDATKYAAGFFSGVLQQLHIAVCKEAIARGINLSVDQVELIKEISQKAILHARAHVDTKG